MGNHLKNLLRLDVTRPFVLAYLQTGEHTCLTSMCDAIEEGDDSTYYPLAQTIRASLLGGF